MTPAAARTGDWDHLAGVTYLDFAAFSALPGPVLEGARSVMAGLATRHRAGDGVFFAMTERVRQQLAELIGAKADDIALTTGAGAGLALLGQSLPWQTGDEILLAAGDFPCHYSTWTPIAARFGLTLREVTASGPFMDAAAMIDALTDRTRLVSISHVRFDDGSLLEVGTLAEACHERGALLALDVSQSAGALPIDAWRLGADFLVCAGYKYLLGPMGTGFLWARPESRHRLLPVPGNWAMQGVQHFAQLRYAQPGLTAAMSRHDAPGSQTSLNLNIALWHESLEYVASVGPAHVLAHTQSLVERLFEPLRPPFGVASPRDRSRRGPFGCLDAGTPQATAALHARLKDSRYVVSLREGRLRVSPYLCTTEADIDGFLEALHGRR